MMRNWINLVEDTAGERTVTFDDLHKHFESKYKIDLYDVNNTHATGRRRRRDAPFFSFWHWMMKWTEGTEFATTENEHWKLVPMPTPEMVPEMSEEDFERKALILQIYKNAGYDPPNKSDGVEEARNILGKIKADFGSPLTLLMSVDR